MRNLWHFQLPAWVVFALICSKTVSQQTRSPFIINGPAVVEPPPAQETRSPTDIFQRRNISSANDKPGNNVQVPNVWTALQSLRSHTGKKTTYELITASVPGDDYPILSSIPAVKSFSCAKVNQPGYYADVDAECQVFRRCDIHGYLYSYLCPNMTLFNQITLVCDWFFNVDCSRTKSFYDYSNPRLYSAWPLLDDWESSDGEIRHANANVPHHATIIPPTSAKPAAVKPIKSTTSTTTVSSTRTAKDRKRMRLFWGASYSA